MFLCVGLFGILCFCMLILFSCQYSIDSKIIFETLKTQWPWLSQHYQYFLYGIIAIVIINLLAYPLKCASSQRNNDGVEKIGANITIVGSSIIFGLVVFGLVSSSFDGLGKIIS